MGKLIDLTGMTFERLTVIERAGVQKTGNSRGHITWRCKCECGSEKIILGYDLRQGKSRSCGCYGRDHTRELKTTHGMSKIGSPAYLCWQNVKKRCYNPNIVGFEHWGGRGIRVCERWRNSFENFYADMGDPRKICQSTVSTTTAITSRATVVGRQEPHKCGIRERQFT